LPCRRVQLGAVPIQSPIISIGCENVDLRR
jgi:hypothetical protein